MKLIPIIFSLLAIATMPVMAATITVDDSGGANYTSIQEAVNNAVAGDKILVYPGNYTESVDVDKKLTIVSLSGNPADTIVHAKVTSDSYYIETDDVFDVTADGVIISGFSLIGATINEYGDDQAGIHLTGSQSCIISNNYLSNNLGLFLTQSDNNMLINNTVFQNNVKGIWLSGSSNNELNGNNVTLNDQEGILLYSRSNDNTLKNNTITSNGFGIFLIADCNNNVLENNYASNNYLGFVTDTNNVIFSNNTAISNSRVGFEITGNNNVLTDNTASSNLIGISLNHAGSCALSNNLASNNVDGIYIYKSSGNELKSNNASNNSRYGVYLNSSSKNNTLISNIVFSNGGEEDILIEDMENNTIRDEAENMAFLNPLFVLIFLLIIFLVVSSNY